jgi:hypothetical protein
VHKHLTTESGVNLLVINICRKVLLGHDSFLLEQPLKIFGPEFEQVPQLAPHINTVLLPRLVKLKMLLKTRFLTAPKWGRGVSATLHIIMEKGHEVLVNNIRFQWRTIRLWELASKKYIKRLSRSWREKLDHVDDLAKTVEP